VVAIMPVRYVFAQNAEIKLKYGTAFPADHPGSVRIKEAAEAIRKDTGGRVDLQVYPASQLGSEPDMISQTRSGAVDFMSTAGTNLQTLVPSAGINGVAFAFKDYTTVWARWMAILATTCDVRSKRSTCTRSTRCSTMAIATSRHRRSRSAHPTT
jgi:TRAP-type C4-dicarboxylate transport system substrate-binding protein